MTTTEQSRAVVAGIYDAGGRGDMAKLCTLVDDSCKVAPPAYFPWAGPYASRDEWMSKCIPQLIEVYDLSTMQIEELLADGDQVVAIIRGKIAGSTDEAVNLEHWKVKDGKAVEMRVYCLDPRPIWKKLGKSPTGA